MEGRTMARTPSIGDDGRCARCRGRHHCAGRVTACGCDCTGAPVTVAGEGPWAGERGTLHGIAFAWCARHEHYLYASGHPRGMRTGRAARIARWATRDTVALPFTDLDTGRRVRGARVSGPARDVSPDAFAERRDAMRDAANASRDRHGAIPSALPSVARDVSPVALTPAARDALARSGEPTTAQQRRIHRAERRAWARAFDARLVSRTAR